MDLADVDTIETKVGAKRHPTEHLARIINAEAIFYILHSQDCKDSGIDLRECEYSLAYDNTTPENSNLPADRTFVLKIEDGRLARMMNY